MMRKHQRDFETIVDGIIAGSGVTVVDIIATPGAGKSSIPIQAMKLIDAGLADALLWVVPRSALQNQGEKGFIDPFFMKMFHHRRIIRASTNDINPCRGTDGFVTTYQAVASDRAKTVLNEVKNRRYIIILDEPHHLENGGVWHSAIDDIVMAGKFLIKMTGTLGRGDKKQIAYIDYRNKRPYFKDGENQRLIVYSRIEALKEKAILPIEFFLSDGEFEWKRHNGKVFSAGSFASAHTPKQQAEALFTALNSKFADQLMENCLTHWQRLRRRVNPGAKLLIITADYNQAGEVLGKLKKHVWLKAEIATSHESAEAGRAIKRFKSGKIDCLVTIAMAYEGLDVPEITHECVLTNIRSREWIEQMLARGVRVDKAAGPYASQKCYVFAPLDVKFRKIVDMIKEQQVAAIEYYTQIKEDKLPEPDMAEDELKIIIPQQEITPISSAMTNQDIFFLGLDTAQPEEMAEPVEVRTIKEQEGDIKSIISRHINRYCYKNRYKQQAINAELKSKFGKARGLMTLKELEKLQEYIQKYYPNNYDKDRFSPPGVSAPRDRARRVSGKVELIEEVYWR